MMGKVITGLALAGALAIVGCGGQGTREAGLGGEDRPVARGTAVAQTAAVPYEVRRFTPAGTGALTLNGVEHSFEVADCRLRPEELPSGYIRNVWLTGAGTMEGRPFFINLSRAHRGRTSNVSLSVVFAPLPAALEVGGYDLTRELSATAMEAAFGADALRSLGLAGLRPEQISVSSGTLTTSGSFRLQRFDGGLLADAPPVTATLSVSCEESS